MGLFVDSSTAFSGRIRVASQYPAVSGTPSLKLSFYIRNLD